MKPRRPWVAVLLSSFVPGLGQLYNGQLARGVLYLGALCACAVLLAYLVPLSFTMLLIATLLLLLVWLAIIIESGLVARRTGAAFAPRRYNHPLAYAAFTAAVLLGVQPAVSLLIERLVFRVIEVRGYAMLPTLKPGEFVLVRNAGGADVRRAHVVALDDHSGRKAGFARVAAAPGDSLDGAEGTPRVGAAAGELYVEADSAAQNIAVAPVRVPLDQVTGIARFVVLSLDATRRIRLDRIGAEVH